MKSGFERGSGCFSCESCGKKTRRTPFNSNTDLCDSCYAKLEAENKEVV